MAALGPAWPSCVLLFLHPHPHQHPCSTPPSTAVPPSDSPVPAGYWLNGATSARLCTGLSALTGESFRSPCAQPQASPSPGRDTTSDSACHVTWTGAGHQVQAGLSGDAPSFIPPLCPQMETLVGGSAYCGLEDEEGTCRWGEEPERRGQRKEGWTVGAGPLRRWRVSHFIMFLFAGWKWQRRAGQKQEVGFTSTRGSQELRSCEVHSSNAFLKVLPEEKRPITCLRVN